MILEKTEPQNNNWSIFFNASLDYIEQNWGFDGKTRDQFREEYKKELSIRVAQGQRLLYLSKTDDAYLGFVNAYLEDKGINNAKTLFIAEFCIFEQLRRRGYGEKMLQQLFRLPECSGIEYVAAEVDKDLPVANAFWKSQMVNLNDDGKRNLYWKYILPNTIELS